MPKLVDAAARRREIAEAVYRVIEREGLAAVTLARVAEEAELAVGSVRHYVGGHNDLLRLTVSTLVDDVRGRLEGYRGATTAGELVAVLEELLPLDDRRRTEAVVWIAFGEAARVDPELAPEMTALYDRVRVLVRRVLNRIRPGGIGGDNAIDAHRLAALMNGLSLDAVQVPRRTTPAVLRRLLRRELEAMLA